MSEGVSYDTIRDICRWVEPRRRPQAPQSAGRRLRLVLSLPLRAERARLGPHLRRGLALAVGPAFPDLLVRRRQDGRVGPERSQGGGAPAGPVRDEPAAPRQLHRGGGATQARTPPGPPPRGGLAPLLRRDEGVVR